MSMEALIKEISDLTVAMKEGGVVDSDKLAATLATKMQEMVVAQVAEQQATAPVRRGQIVGVDGAVITRGNRYYHTAQRVVTDGYATVGNQRVKAIDLFLAKMLLDAAATRDRKVKAASDDLNAALKALDSTTTGAGAELVPLPLVDSLWEDMFLASRVAGLFSTLPMTSGSMEIPLGLGQITWRKGTQNTVTTVSNPATDKVDFKTTELVAEVNWSYTLDEDAVVALMPTVRARFAQSGAEAMDAFLLNADATNAATGNINSDDADPADDNYFLSDGQDGLRHQWLIDNGSQAVDAAGPLTDAVVVAALARMGKYAVDPTKLAMICDVQTYLKGFLSLDGVTTLDKFGSQAVLLTGQIGAYRGIPIILSASAPATEADGKVSATPANNIKGQLTIVNRDMWYVGWMRDLLIEIDRDIQKRQHIMVGSFRQAVAAHGTRSTNKHTAGARNISI